VVLQRRDELIREAFRRHVQDARVRPCFEHAMTDRIHQVCLAETDATVNEQWIVTRTRARSGSDARSVRELIARADNKALESVARIQIGLHRRDLILSRTRCSWRR
jgi:hypothetical protein